MWMSNIYIMVNQDNTDKNSFYELRDAVAETGATILDVDEESFMIEANAPSHEVPVIAAMEGVSYIRCVFSYMAQEEMQVA